MIEQILIEHHIQKHILTHLMHHRYARFRDMRPDGTDTNLYSYHLKQLQKNNFVEKKPDGYTLTTLGMSYVDRINANSVNISLQPKIITMLIVQNDEGGTLMYQKARQPFIEQWTVPFGKVHNDDASILDAAKREVREKIGPYSIPLTHAGDCYIRMQHEGAVKFSTLVHVFYGVTTEPIQHDQLQWVSPHTIPRLDVAPAVDEIIARTFFRDPYFFEEYTVDW